MTPDELKQIPEPPVGTLIELHFDYATPEHLRRYDERGWMTLRDVFNAKFEPASWESIINVTDLARAFLWERKLPLPPETKHVSPDQMQDGKRYRVIFEGEYKFPDYVQEGMLELLTGELEAWHTRLATRIEELGGERIGLSVTSVMTG